MTPIEIMARAIAPLAWAALDTCDTVAHAYRRETSIRLATAALSALQRDGWMLGDEWMPIETAPKDIEVLLGWWNGQWRMAIDFAGSTKGGWSHGQATYWQHLPAPPQNQEGL